jgi:putative NADH-flavin reductase
MKLVVVAATGGVGRQVLAQAVAAGHDVTAVVRNPARMSATASATVLDAVRKVAVDLADADAAALESAIGGADAVLSCLGPTGVIARGTRSVVDAMAATGVRRIVVVSAAPVGTVASPGRPRPPRHDPGDGVVMRYVLNPMIKKVLRAHYADTALMEDVLRDSGLDWTSVRPPRLTDKDLTGHYRTAIDQNLRRGVLISRADVAHFMLRALDRPETIRRAVGVAY